MAGSLLQYSGLVTKTRAMDGRLLTQEELFHLTEYESVQELIDFLRESKVYGKIYQNNDMVHHRSQVEEILIESLFDDLGKLYSFSNKTQRQCMEVPILRCESIILKRYLWCVLQGKPMETSYKHQFLADHASLPLDDIAHVTSVADLLTFFQNTAYSRILRVIADHGDATYADYAAAIDREFFKATWRTKEKLPKGTTRDVVEELMGTEIDWQNIMWIYRQKQFFDCSKADIYDSIIPIRYRLKKREIDAMVEAERAEQIKDILAKSAYFTGPDPVVTLEDEISSNDVMDRVYRRACRRYPMSIAPVYQYLRDKLHEIDVLTTIIEGVRYRIPPRDIQESIVIL